MQNKVKRTPASVPFLQCQKCGLIIPFYRFEEHKKECPGYKKYGTIYSPKEIKKF